MLHRYSGAERYFLLALRQLQRVYKSRSRSGSTGSSALCQTWEPLLNNLGHVSRKLGKFEDALGFHRQALVLRPHSASTFSSIGYVHALRGDLAEAVDMFHKALGIRRDDAFSTTMLKSVVEQMIGEEAPFAGDEEDIPQLSLPSSMSTPGLLQASMNDSTASGAGTGMFSASSVANQSSDIEMSDVTID